MLRDSGEFEPSARCPCAPGSRKARRSMACATAGPLAALTCFRARTCSACDTSMAEAALTISPAFESNRANIEPLLTWAARQILATVARR